MTTPTEADVNALWAAVPPEVTVADLLAVDVDAVKLHRGEPAGFRFGYLRGTVAGVVSGSIPPAKATDRLRRSLAHVTAVSLPSAEFMTFLAVIGQHQAVAA